jgi:peptidoglycan hydrolase-like protein with peptidoglycan-binding domain
MTPERVAGVTQAQCCRPDCHGRPLLGCLAVNRRVSAPAWAALLLLSACSGGDTDADTTTTPAAPGLTPVVSSAPGVSAPIQYAKSVFDAPVQRGDQGDNVARVQDRLRQLGFDPGPIDGRFGTATVQAVWAYQKLSGTPRKQADGVVTPELWSRMQDPFPLAPYDGQARGTFLEVDLVRQVAVVWNDRTPRLITHVSTGDGTDYCSEIGAWCSTAITPAGAYSVTREIGGWRESELGKLYNPVYFNGGIAVHGSENVPLYPDSHGCVRIPMHIAEYFPTLMEKGNEVLVYDGVLMPREYGSPAAPPNVADPSRTTTLPTTETVAPEPPATTTAVAPPTAAPTTPPTAPPPTAPPTTKPRPTTTVPPTTLPPTTLPPTTIPVTTAPPATAPPA